MGHCSRMLIALLFFVLAWVCLLYAGIGVPENPADLSDTSGLPAVAIYITVLQVAGVVAIAITSLGMLFSIRLETSAFWVRVMTFVVANTVLVVASLAGILILCGYVLDTVLGIVGVILYIAVIIVVISAAPRRAGALLKQ